MGRVNEYVWKIEKPNDKSNEMLGLSLNRFMNTLTKSGDDDSLMVIGSFEHYIVYS